jgi:hypothetical protein
MSTRLYRHMCSIAVLAHEMKHGSYTQQAIRVMYKPACAQVHLLTSRLWHPPPCLIALAGAIHTHTAAPQPPQASAHTLTGPAGLGDGMYACSQLPPSLEGGWAWQSATFSPQLQPRVVRAQLVRHKQAVKVW